MVKKIKFTSNLSSCQQDVYPFLKGFTKAGPKQILLTYIYFEHLENPVHTII